MAQLQSESMHQLWHCNFGHSKDVETVLNPSGGEDRKQGYYGT